MSGGITVSFADYRDAAYREVNEYVIKTAWIVNEKLKQYSYKELIRHWNGTPAEYSRTVSGNLSDEDGQPFTAELLIGCFHPNAGIYHKDYKSIGMVNGAFSTEVDMFRILANEASLPEKQFFTDTLCFILGLGFYTISSNIYKRIDYQSYAEIDLGEIRLAGNRIVEFLWVYAADGIFTGSEIPESGVINTVDVYDFFDWDLGLRFCNSFSDPRLGTWYINTYSFNGGEDNEREDLNAEFDHTAGGVNNHPQRRWLVDRSRKLALEGLASGSDRKKPYRGIAVTVNLCWYGLKAKPNCDHLQSRWLFR